MGTIAEKLQYLKDTKSQIGAAIEEKGVPVPSGKPFRGYADLIRDIETGSIGELQSGEVTPTGETFVQYPDDGYDGFSSVTVQGDPNLTPQNIAAGVTIYGKVGTLQPGATSLVPEEYQPYVEHALLLYTGEYANMAILEGHTYLSIVFLMDNFTITSFDSTTTEFKASGWLSCSLNKFTDTWTVTDWRDKPSEGQNYVKNIRYSSVYWTYNGKTIWPVGTGGGDSPQSEVYDMVVVPKTDTVYTVPRDGTLFIVSNFDCETLGFETQIRKSHTECKDDLFAESTQTVYVGRKDVVAGETVSIPECKVNTLLVLAESGSNVVDISVSTCRFPYNASSHTEISFNEISRLGGFCYLSIVYSFDNYDIFEQDGLNMAAFYPFRTSGIGWGVPGYATGVSDHFSYKPNSVVSGNNSYKFVKFSLSTSGTPVSDIDTDTVELKVVSKVYKYFEAGAFSTTSDVDGYMVFVGAYREPDGFPLSGFTVVKEATRNIDVYVQTEVIAYKAVTKGEVISWNTTGRAGGTFYAVTGDLSRARIVAGDATLDENKVVYPTPSAGEHDVMFGVTGFVWSDCTVEPANVKRIDTTDLERLKTFYANKFTAEDVESGIYFPYREFTYAGDVQGVWAKFVFDE